MSFTFFQRWFGLCAALGVMAGAGVANGQTGKAQPEYVVAVFAEDEDALYSAGDSMYFIVTVEHKGSPLQAGAFEWKITKDGVEPTRQGTGALENGRGLIEATLAEPGFLRCQVTFSAEGKKYSGEAAAGFSPLEIGRSAPLPEDFDAFWAAQKAEIAAVPLKFNLTPVEPPAKWRGKAEAFDLQADAVDEPVSGYLVRPAGAKPRSLPAILSLHGAGVRSASLDTAAANAGLGLLALDINAHGLPNGQPESFYKELAAGKLNRYGRTGLGNRDTIYFRKMYQRVLRALDVLKAQPEWDGRTLILYGSSQGGGQGAAAAALDPDVTMLIAGVPAMVDPTGRLVGRVYGIRNLVRADEQGNYLPGDLEAVRYYDTVNFSERIGAEVLFVVGFLDRTCPPTAVYAAYNRLSGKKRIYNDVAAGHSMSDAGRRQLRDAITRHVREQAAAAAAGKRVE